MRVAWARFGQRFGRPRVSANYQINRSYHSHEATRFLKRLGPLLTWTSYMNSADKSFMNVTAQHDALCVRCKTSCAEMQILERWKLDGRGVRYSLAAK